MRVCDGVGWGVVVLAGLPAAVSGGSTSPRDQATHTGRYICIFLMSVCVGSESTTPYRRGFLLLISVFI